MAVAKKTVSKTKTEDKIVIPKRTKERGTKVKSKEVKKKETMVMQDVYKGSPVFQVWEKDEDGEPKGDYPLLALGLGKIALIKQHFKELKAFFEEHSSEKQD